MTTTTQTDLTFTIPAGVNFKDVHGLLEASFIEKAYAACKYNQLRTAKALGISRGTFRKKLKVHFGDKYL